LISNAQSFASNVRDGTSNECETCSYDQTSSIMHKPLDLNPHSSEEALVVVSLALSTIQPLLDGYDLFL
jgi:hypothetical protein